MCFSKKCGRVIFICRVVKGTDCGLQSKKEKKEQVKQNLLHWVFSNINNWSTVLKTDLKQNIDVSKIVENM